MGNNSSVQAAACSPDECARAELYIVSVSATVHAHAQLMTMLTDDERTLTVRVLTQLL